MLRTSKSYSSRFWSPHLSTSLSASSARSYMTPVANEGYQPPHRKSLSCRTSTIWHPSLIPFFSTSDARASIGQTQSILISSLPRLRFNSFLHLRRACPAIAILAQRYFSRSSLYSAITPKSTRLIKPATG
ncbi:hypothetical protein BDV98DRAFT_213376 [Pterulicium gracile]|uniref:Uncharacterized protein n=1 Tax=Pterulicium gracile TaxID=1884261 RepID=A0A5C3QDD5_9AGAR|nr:hypothetical protein BDV98DRAFT_213376 [Pterula gracilis]